jgi:hypothetical protein
MTELVQKAERWHRRRSRFAKDGYGLRIMDLETKAVATFTGEYDNFPLWSSPRRSDFAFTPDRRRV